MVAVNMEMPKSCSQCPLCIEDKYADMTCVLLCEEWEESNYNENHRDENCPLAEIVTCKDCKYYRVEDDDEYCTNHTIKDNKFWVREDYFCADGERRN